MSTFPFIVNSNSTSVGLIKGLKLVQIPVQGALAAPPISCKQFLASFGLEGYFLEQKLGGWVAHCTQRLSNKNNSFSWTTLVKTKMSHLTKDDLLGHDITNDQQEL